MNEWTEKDFDRIAAGTKLSLRTVSACRDVLVHGIAGVEASVTHKMFPAQISRAIGLLRERRVDMLEAESLGGNDALANSSDKQMRKYIALQVAKSLSTGQVTVEEAKPGVDYSGPVVAITHGFVIQKVGRSNVLHDLSKLSHKPQMNMPLDISYSKGGGAGLVNEGNQEVTQKNGIGR